MLEAKRNLETIPLYKGNRQTKQNSFTWIYLKWTSGSCEKLTIDPKK